MDTCAYVTNTLNKAHKEGQMQVLEALQSLHDSIMYNNIGIFRSIVNHAIVGANDKVDKLYFSGNLTSPNVVVDAIKNNRMLYDIVNQFKNHLKYIILYDTDIKPSDLEDTIQFQNDERKRIIHCVVNNVSRRVWTMWDEISEIPHVNESCYAIYLQLIQETGTAMLRDRQMQEDILTTYGYPKNVLSIVPF